MKIGVITFWDSEDNYGQQLQLYAMQQHLLHMGHAPFLIRYRPTHQQAKFATHGKRRSISRYLFDFRTYFKYWRQCRRNVKYAKISRNSERQFKLFLKENVITTEKVYSAEELYRNPPVADAYICGSDQIWSGDTVYYLPFVPKGTPKIAYAPSFGGNNPFVSDSADEIRDMLSDFSFIGVREASGVETLRQGGISNATQVVDPTLLLEAEDYNAIASESGADSDVFIYFLGNEMACSIHEVMRYVKKNGWTYTYVASQGRVDRYPKAPLSIPQWIGALSRSKVVITNSFHCVVFSLIFHKPFIFIPLAGSYSRMNDRLTDLLSKCGLESQIYAGNMQAMNLTCDFSTFDNYRCAEQSRSTEILNSLLSSGHNE